MAAVDPRADLLRVSMRVMKISQAELSRRTGVSAKHLNQVLQGKANARFEMWDRLAKGLGLVWSYSLIPIGHDHHYRENANGKYECALCVNAPSTPPGWAIEEWDNPEDARYDDL